MMNLEARPVMFEDIGRQVLASSKHLPAQHYYNEIGRGVWLCDFRNKPARVNLHANPFSFKQGKGDFYFK